MRKQNNYYANVSQRDEYKISFQDENQMFKRKNWVSILCNNFSQALRIPEKTIPVLPCANDKYRKKKEKKEKKTKMLQSKQHHGILMLSVRI